MTQVQAMTDQQLNRVLAELMGYKVIKVSDGEFAYELQDSSGQCINSDGRGWESEEYAWAGVPCYTADPAASLEVQTAAIAKYAAGYMRNLAKVQGWTAGGIIALYEAAQLANASPRERAEAAYITLSSKQ